MKRCALRYPVIAWLVSTYSISMSRDEWITVARIDPVCEGDAYGLEPMSRPTFLETFEVCATKEEAFAVLEMMRLADPTIPFLPEEVGWEPEKAHGREDAEPEENPELP